jgi:hypothetical protein
MAKQTVPLVIILLLLISSNSFSQIGSFTAMSIDGKDEVGVSLPAVISSNVNGMNWKVNPVGSNRNNTQGRILRLSQNFGALHFYDMGIDKQQSFFIMEHTMVSNTPASQKRIFVISPSNYVGINMKENNMPTATLHVDGNVRFENLSVGLGQVLAVDENGYIFKKPAENNTDYSKDINELKSQIEQLKKQNEELAKQIEEIKKKPATAPVIKKN